jgi:hypothetical protein
MKEDCPNTTDEKQFEKLQKEDKHFICGWYILMQKISLDQED